MAVRVVTGQVESVVELPAQAWASRHSGFHQAQIERLSDLVIFNAPPGRAACGVVAADARVRAA